MSIFLKNIPKLAQVHRKLIVNKRVIDLKSDRVLKMRSDAPMPQQIATTTMPSPKVPGMLC